MFLEDELSLRHRPLVATWLAQALRIIEFLAEGHKVAYTGGSVTARLLSIMVVVIPRVIITLLGILA